MKGRYLRPAATGVALSLTAVMLTGCGSLPGLSGDNEVTLRVVAADYGDNPQNTSKGYWKDLAAGFEEEHPGVKVEVSVYSWSEVDAKVAAMVKAGKAPRHRADRRLRRLRGGRQAVHGRGTALRADRGRLPRAARRRGQGQGGTSTACRSWPAPGCSSTTRSC
ncbi:hypothetical protein GCM10020254_47250 [Streptomyces goshikiensis]